MKQKEFIDIIQQYQKMIYKVCSLYASDPVDRQDLEQEILIQLWLSIDRFRGKSKLSTWIYRVALNTAIGYARKLTSHHNYRESIDDSVLSLQIEDNKSETQDVDRLYHSIKQLNTTDRAIIMLYLDQLKQQEIAEIIGISTSNVATKVSRIKTRLSKIMKPKNNNNGY